MFSKTFFSPSRILRKVEAHLQPKERHQASAVPIVAAGHLHQDDSQDPNDSQFVSPLQQWFEYCIPGGLFHCIPRFLKKKLEWLACSATMGNIRPFSSVVSHSNWPWASFSWLWHSPNSCSVIVSSKIHILKVKMFCNHTTIFSGLTHIFRG